ncbi:DUF354 domain-containing protein [Natronorubrum daqingense]|uniref:DUF354 domain-containing protein n=1 Tax=Natronorubrum daqingense TaxID=588898 RepID=A0A1N7ENN7_9EURY|nr:DUF354 domain-containing protein [Natronorubrum daqingense]APX97838.1 hypothetical protein BB347_15100 [Natronorubrum daqingense]SIR89684.1 hypothetical protein SAMN05421809_2733 [Natronorubrum daqingense]
MNCLIFNNTPAHVHQYKHAVTRLEERGHDVLVFARSDEFTESLLSYHDLPYETYGERSESLHSLAYELPSHLYTIARRVRAFDPDVIFGKGPYAAAAGMFSRTPAIAVLDSETSYDHVVARPFVRAILTPSAFRKDLGSKHYKFNGVAESAYLHPDVFEPDPSVRDDLGVAADEPYAIVRLNAFNGHHDVGKRGFSLEQRRRLLSELSEHATVFVSDEAGDLEFSDLPAESFDLHPAKMHDALAHADLLVADTQTMVTEAALLGTPAIRSNSFVGEEDMGNFIELEEHGLVRNLESFEDVLEQSQELLADESSTDRWERRRDEYVEDMDNLTELLCNIATAYGDRQQQPTAGTATGVN